VSPVTDPDDILAIQTLLTFEEPLIRDTVRKFVRDRILPEIATWFEITRSPGT
jgi:glutaryl-CoA dehydrogenase